MWEAFLAILTLSMATGAAPEQHCKYDDVLQYLNISSEKAPPLHTIPKENWKEPLKVETQFILISILSVNEKLQTVTVYFVVTMEWKNVFVTWNPQDFCNISKLVLPVDTFWSPYIVIYEQVDEEKSLSRPFLSITHNGIISTTQQHQATITCSLEMHQFPFDSQTCNLSIFSSMYSDIILLSKQTTEEANKQSQLYHLTNGEWKFMNINIIEYTDSVDKEEFAVIIYQISMKRRPILYVLNLIFPTCVLYLLDMAILFSASSYGDKISFQLSLIIGESVLAVILKDILPTSSDDPPIIVMFFIGVFVLMIMGVLETCLLMQLKKKPLHPLLKAIKLLRCHKQARTASGNLLSKQGDSLTEMARGQEERRDSSPLGKGNTELPMLMETINAEGKRIGTQAEVQECESTLLVLEKVLFCSHLLLSLLFSIIIIVQWSS
ncbi:5-hydroxytryptamine receptor 3A-like [Malaclemys terrapin pileata]|uniref:5-hydroxytryptamine receptor 3A-like n=1 Tax=Malaclemys terrapin pileata TaxID=2991368 RepID=UPI0023A81A64|nr:5-hydroxytryptamine receptor 3A-like [Malaclemys terrapin pileata]